LGTVDYGADKQMTKGIILVVEDEFLIGISVCDQLEEDGYDTDLVSGAKEAMSRIETHGPYSALLTDIRMPGENGWWLAREARSVDPRLPVLYMSGDSSADWGTEGVPGSQMIDKPFDRAHLLLALGTVTHPQPLA